MCFVWIIIKNKLNNKLRKEYNPVDFVNVLVFAITTFVTII
jgi:hypothetical protein